MQEREFIPAHLARKRGLLRSQPPTRPLCFRAIVDDSVRYWELRRLAYNLVLTLIVLIVDFAGHGGMLMSRAIPQLAVLAVLANLGYSVAYLPDLLFGYSSFRSFWLAVRPLLFAFGTTLAALLAYQALGLLVVRVTWD